MTTEERLKELGDTAEVVAANLLRLGFIGDMGSDDSCPVILFVNSDDRIKVWGGMTAASPGVITWDDPQILDPMCPRPVAEMMRRFDDGEFSELRR
jgi:hypothetical protein